MGGGNPSHYYMDQIYIPYVCNITDITSSGQQTIVTTDITHAFVVGNQVQLLVPQNWGMYQADNLKGIVQAITEHTVTLNIDSSHFNAFVTPSPPPTVVIQPAQIIPIGGLNYGYLEPGGVTPTEQTVPGAFQAILT